MVANDDIMAVLEKGDVGQKPSPNRTHHQVTVTPKQKLQEKTKKLSILSHTTNNISTVFT